MGLMDGKKGFVFGVANDYSLAWQIALKLHEERAALAFNYLPNPKMERRVRLLAEPIGAKLLVPCDVSDDEQIKAVAAKGGVVGCSSFPALVWRGETPPTLDEFVACIDYVVNLVGPDHVAIGTDSEASKGAYPPELRASLRRAYSGTTGTFHQRFPQGLPLVGLEEGLGDWPNITRCLLERGYRPDDVRKIIGGNFFRVMNEVWR